MADRCEYCGSEEGYGHTAVCVMNEVAELRANNERLRNALNEMLTNGHWTEGEQCGEWAVSPEVYATGQDAIDAPTGKGGRDG